MADLVGKDGIHHVAGACELCGGTCDAGVEELNALTCTFAQCNASVYHQDCLEKYLKRSGCEKNRKTGFPCPRGRGKVKSSDQCPGRIDKSHPIHPRKEDKIKKVKPAPPPVEKKYGPAAKEARRKEKEEREKHRVLEKQKADEEARAAAKAAATAKKAVVPDPKKHATTIEALRREIAGQPAPKEPVKAPPAQQQYTLDDYEARKHPAPAPAAIFRPAQPTNNAWNSKPAPVLPEPEKPDLTPSAFPSIPGSKVPMSKAAPVVVVPAVARSWKASLAATPTEPSQEPSLTTLAAPFPRQPPPPPPPPRSDSMNVSLETSICSSQAMPHGAHMSLQGGSSRVATGNESSHSSQTSGSPDSVSHTQGSVLQPSMLFDGASHSTLPSRSLADDAQLESPAHLDHLMAARGGMQQGKGGMGSKVLQRNGLQDLTVMQQGRAVLLQACGDDDVGDNGTDMLRKCMTELARFKALCCLYKLSCVGFDQWLCLAAMQRAGVDGDRASEWILDQHDPGKAWIDEVVGYQGPSMRVDISYEMEVIEQVLRVLPPGVGARDVHIAVLHSKGDLHAAISRVIEGHQRLNGHVGTQTAEAVLNGM